MRLKKDSNPTWHGVATITIDREGLVKVARLAAGKESSVRTSLVWSGLVQAKSGERERRYKVRRDSPPLSVLFRWKFRNLSLLTVQPYCES